MNTVKKIIIGGISSIAIIAGATAYADRGDGDRSGKMIERISSKLELDDNQTAALTTLSVEIQETRELMRGDSDNWKSEITGLITADTFDQGAALEMINQRAAALQANAPELVAAAAVFLDGLSAEQKAQIEGFSDKMGKRGRRH